MVKKLVQREVKLIHPENGGVIVLVALLLSIFLGLCAFVVDLGVIYVNYTHLRNTLDAAVLAGVQELPSSPSKAQNVALQYAQDNGIPQVTIGFAQNDYEINASASGQVSAIFSKIWGLKENSISASARAMMVTPSSITGAVPLSIQEQVLNFGTVYSLKAGAGDSTNGWFGPLALSGTGANDYQSDLTSGYPGKLSIGQVLDLQSGDMSGPTKKAIEDRMAADQKVPQNTYDDYERNAPELVYLPIVKLLQASGKVQIVGFAAFFLEGTTGNGTNSFIQGRFIRTIVTNGRSTGSLSNLQRSEAEMQEGQLTSDFGLYASKLLP